MINIPYEQIIEKITKEKDIPAEEIEDKVKQKMDQLSGLISKQGAAHIIANELGVKIVDPGNSTVTSRVKVKDIMPNMRNLEVLGKITATYDLKEFNRKDGGSGKLCSFFLGDETGSIRAVGWGSLAEKAAELKTDDIVLLQSVYVKQNQSRKELHLNDKSNIIVNPPNESVEDVKKFTSTRKKIKDLSPDETDIELLGTIVQVYDPRFFEVCPECNTRLKQNAEQHWECPQHGKVNHDYSYVLNVFLDDGTDNLRCIFFRNQMQNLLEKTHEDILKYKEVPDSFQSIKQDLLGKMIKVIGRASMNDMFGRLEFIAQVVFPNPSPDEEMKDMEASSEKVAEQPAAVTEEKKEESTKESVSAGEKEEESVIDTSTETKTQPSKEAVLTNSEELLKEEVVSLDDIPPSTQQTSNETPKEQPKEEFQKSTQIDESELEEEDDLEY
ncbi:hypothetical protein ACFL0W_05095 [Nanoarchaeota archaeon]